MSWKEIFKMHGMKSMLQDYMYRLDWRKPNEASAKDFLIKQVEEAKALRLQHKLPRFLGTRDEIMLKCLAWVTKTITYEPDQKRFKVAEKWQTIRETLDFQRGDCEDGAILLYCVARVNGISPAQMKLVAGDVLGGGHCWVEYFCDEYFERLSLENSVNWYTMDWCYWTDSRTFSERSPKDKTKYFNAWFEITDFKEE